MIKEKQFKMTIHIIPEPTKCPYCGSNLERQIENGAHLYCTNPDCPERNLKKLSYFVTKECMNIDGISEKTLTKLWNADLIRHWWDLYDMSEEDFREAGCGEKTSKKIYDELEKSKTNVPAQNILMALGIPMVGKVTAEILLKYFKSIEDLQHASQQEIASVEGVGDVCASCVYNYMQENINELNHLYELFDTRYKSDNKVKSTSLEGKCILATGTLQHFTRDSIKQSVVENGGIYASGMSKKLTFLIVGEAPGQNKIKKAEELNIPMISEEDYLQMIN